MKEREKKADKNCTHLSGEYFVAAELCKRGYSVGITMGNAKAVDILIEKERRTVNVQVKAICSKKQVGWPMMKEKVLANIVYVLVCLNDLDETPTYFVLTSRETKLKVKQYRTRGIIDYRDVDDNRYRGRWDKIEHTVG